MPRRIDIELTSTRPDGTWTWRAAGAKEPKGVLDGSLLHAAAKAGDVLKADAEFEIEGITIVSVVAPKADARNEPQRIEILGPPRTETPGVTTQLVGRQERRGPSRRREGEQRERSERSERGDRGDRGARDAGRGPDRRHATSPERSERPARQGGAPADRRDRPRRGQGAHERDASNGATAGAELRARPDDAGAGSRDGTRRPARRPERTGSGARGAPPRQDDRGAKRLSPGHAHRDAILESLPPEQRPVAEQVLRGGIPAVRTALHLEREKAEAEGRPAPATDQLIAMAEDLLPRLKAAEWRDRAEAAAKTSEEISLRDLRSVVAGSDVARDEETRNLAATLREALDRRLETQRAHWSEEITKQLDEGRVVRALRLSSRPPEPAARLDDELSKRLADAAGEAMSPSASADLWLALLDAAVASPVRRTISPAGLPPDGPSEVRQAALQQSSRIPALAAMLGVSIPPPPVRKPPPEGRPQPARRPEGRPPRRPDARPRPARRPGEPPADESEPAAKAEPESQTPAAPTVAAEPEPTPVEAEPASVTDEEPVAAPPPSVAEPEPAPPPVEAEAAAAPEADTESTPASDSAPPAEDDEPSAPAGEDA